MTQPGDTAARPDDSESGAPMPADAADRADVDPAADPAAAGPSEAHDPVEADPADPLEPASDEDVLDAIPDAIVAFDAAGRITRWNGGAARIFGLAAEAAIGGTLDTMLPPDRTTGRDPLAAALAAGVPMWEGDLGLRAPDGSIRLVEIVAYGGTGRVARVLLAWDVTDLRAETEAAARLTAVMEQADDAIYAIDRDGRALAWNAGAERLTGFTAAEMLGRTGPFAAPDDVKAELRRRGFEDGEFVKLTGTVLRHRDGGTVPVDMSVSPVRTPDGRVIALSAIARDARPRLAAESELRFREAILSAVEDAVVVTDDTTRVVYWSPGAERQFGIPSDAAIGQVFGELVGFRPIEASDAQVERAMRTDGTVRVDGSYRRADGTTFTGDTSGVVMRAADGTALLLGVIRDVTAFRRAAADSARLAAIVEGAGDIIIGTTLDATIVTWNPAAERALGYSAAEMAGRTIATYIAPEHLPLAFDLRRRLTEGGAASASAEFRYIARDGTSFPVWVTIAPVRDAAGRITGVSAVAHDLRVRKALEEQVRQAQKLEAVGRLAGGVAHDFNNLLTAITGYASLIAAELPAGSPAGADVDQVLDAAERAAELTRSLLAFSRGKPREPRLVALDAVVHEAEPMLRRLLPERIRLVVEARSGVTLMADPTELELVLVNLAVNGADAMPMGGRLEVRAARVELDQAFADAHLGVRPGPHAELLVRDTGGGMTDEVRDHLFEPFFTTKADRGAAGLGLTTVHAMVEGVGGTIWVDSERDRGTAFRILLPVAEGVAEPLIPPSAGTSRGPGGTERLLLVEDDAQVRALATTILARAGYRVTPVGDPREAELVDPATVDLLVSDVVMPHVDGPALAASLRARRPDLPVVFMSGYTDRADTADLEAVTDQPLLAKPFGPGDLLRAVRRGLDERPGVVEAP